MSVYLNNGTIYYIIQLFSPSSCEETLDEPIPHQDTIAVLHCKVVAPLPSAMLLESLGKVH